jgi:Ca-activated chloride channel family protein
LSGSSSGRSRLLFLLLFACSGFCLYSFAQDALKVEVNLVNVFATVQDQHGDYVTGLDASDFRLYDDDVEQPIAIFEKEDQVESAVAILLDNSGSMVDILPLMKTGTLEFARQAKRLDDLCVLSFGITVRLVQDFRGDSRKLETRLQGLRAYGTSILFDALNEAMTKLQDRDQERKALIVFTDGNDNGSKVGFGAVEEAAQRSGVLIYFIAIGPRIHVDEHTVEALAGDSGGRVIYMAKTESVPAAITSIRTELAKQYYLGYYIAPRRGSHKIRVQIPGRDDLRIRAKSGYTG